MAENVNVNQETLQSGRAALGELAAVFLKLGATAFGGPYRDARTGGRASSKVALP